MFIIGIACTFLPYYLYHSYCGMSISFVHHYLYQYLYCYYYYQLITPIDREYRYVEIPLLLSPLLTAG